MSLSLTLDIVSREKSIYSGSVLYVKVTGIYGEMGICHGHTPLLTKLVPGVVTITDSNDMMDYFYISGGILEVQHNYVTILADVAERGADLDEQAALLAKQQAEALLSNKQSSRNSLDAKYELAQAVAQLKVIRELRNKHE